MRLVVYSAETEPRLPVLKFSTDRTVFFSRGTLVPPEVTSAILAEVSARKEGKFSILIL